MRAYFSLPVDRFGTLQGVSLRRIDEEDDAQVRRQRGRFLLTVDPVRFFDMLVVEPQVTCHVVQAPPGEAVQVVSSEVELTGQPAGLLEAVNACFEFRASTTIGYDENCEDLCISGTIVVAVEPPPPFDAFPATVLKTTGEAVLGAATATLHRVFMNSLRADFEAFVEDSATCTRVDGV